MSSPLPLGDVLEFLRLIWAVDHGLHTTSKRMERTLGVTAPQRLALRLIGRFPGLTVTRLAEVLRVHASTASGIVRRLERRGLVRRRSDTRDRRRALLGLTAKGRTLDVEHPHTVEGAVRRVLASLPPGSVAGAQAVLASLADALSLVAPTDA